MKICGDSFKSDDLIQGSLGNCYFLAGLVALTDEPSRIHKLLMTKEVNKNGIYHVRLFVNGLQTSVVVDDFVPVYKNSR